MKPGMRCIWGESVTSPREVLSGVRRWRDGHPDDDLLAEQSYYARVVSGQLDL